MDLGLPPEFGGAVRRPGRRARRRRRRRRGGAARPSRSRSRRRRSPGSRARPGRSRSPWSKRARPARRPTKGSPGRRRPSEKKAEEKKAEDGEGRGARGRRRRRRARAGQGGLAVELRVRRGAGSSRPSCRTGSRARSACSPTPNREAARAHARHRAGHVLQPLARRALGEGRDERQHAPRRVASSPTATPTRSSTWSIPRARPATPAARAASSAGCGADGVRRGGRPSTPPPSSRSSSAEIEARKASTAAKSYTRHLLDGGPDRIGAKIREEADELARGHRGRERTSASRARPPTCSTTCSSGLASRGVPLRGVLAALAARSGTSGHDEKARRGEG